MKEVKQMEKMCLYPIQEAPYLAVANAYKVSKNTYAVEDTKGRLKKVDPLYVGPFDYEKLFEFGVTVNNYFSNKCKDLDIQNKICNIFGISPLTM